ncbi:hypothetical protein BJ085DRAFT_41049 [Dimargaris cristalligena]|uniref:Zn(2)-C6 fungal-type domain-containing protein n=1 Tax=Dimargaris cristalligena TaxID=215637 RepID=A0A4P9ZYI7_9FUNG|nr:hypothetical protein BJ085DRAFT_41049 [Dimargaris cristalligena]|eukprot:RKP38131.1 hypothetical protein BJ085DRAFT_41049 [Dimargaris cristalligena]
MYGVYTEFSGIQFRRCCNECLRRKVRCDGQRPCSNCERRRHPCQYSLIRRKPPTPSYRSLTKNRTKTTAPASPEPAPAPTLIATTPLLENPPPASRPESMAAAATLDPLVQRLFAIVEQCENLAVRGGIDAAPPSPATLTLPPHLPPMPGPVHWLSGPDSILTGIPDNDTQDFFILFRQGHLDVNQVWTATVTVHPPSPEAPLPREGASRPVLQNPAPANRSNSRLTPPSRPVTVEATITNRYQMSHHTQMHSTLARAAQLLAEPVDTEYLLYHPSVVHSLVNLYFTRSGCLLAEAQQTRFLRLLFNGQVSPLVLNATLCIAARFSHDPRLVRGPAYMASLPYWERAERDVLRAMEEPSLDSVIAFHLLTAWAIGQSDLGKLMTYSSMSSRMSTALQLHSIDSKQPPSGWPPESTPTTTPSTTRPLLAPMDRARLDTMYHHVRRQVFWSIASTDFASAMFSSSKPVTDIEAIAVQPPDEALLATLFDPEASSLFDQDRRLPAIIPPTFITSYVPHHFTSLSLLIGKVATFRNQMRQGPPAGGGLGNRLMALNRELTEWYRRLPADTTLPGADVTDDVLFQRALDILQLLQFHARYQTAVILLNTRDPQATDESHVSPRAQSIARTIAWNAAEWVCRHILPLARRFRVEFHGPMTGGYFYYASWVYVTELLAHSPEPTTPNEGEAMMVERGGRSSSLRGGSGSSSCPLPPSSRSPATSPTEPPIETFRSVHTPLILHPEYRDSRSHSSDGGRDTSSTPDTSSPHLGGGVHIIQDANYCVQRLYDIYSICKQHIPYWSYNHITCNFIRQQLQRSKVITQEQFQLFS